MRWMLRNVLDLATVPPHQHTPSDFSFSLPVFFFFPSVLLPSSLSRLVFIPPLSFSRSLTLSPLYQSSPGCPSSNRGCAAQPGRGAAGQRVHGDGGPQRRPHLRHPGDSASAHHLEEERHHTQLLRPGGHQCECTLLPLLSQRVTLQSQFVLFYFILIFIFWIHILHNTN